MSGLLRPGQPVHITDTHERVVIWDAAPGPGCYWATRPAHGGEVVLIQVRSTSEKPLIVIKEEWP